TGAARGIGRAIAERLAAESARVVVADVDGSGAAAVAAELRERGASACHHELDVSRPEEAPALMRRAVDEFGQLDVLVNNAGILEVTDLMDVDVDEWNRVLSVNVLGTFFCLQSAAREMISRGGGGAIVNMSSLIG